MGVDCKFWYEHVRKDDLNYQIENTKTMIDHLHKELVALAAMTPKNERHKEGWEPFEYVVNKVDSIMESLDEHMTRLTMLNLIQTNENYSPDENEWDES